MSETMTPREIAMAEVRKHQEVVARWEAESAASTAELESLQERAGEEVLADESAAMSLPRSMQELRDRIDIASRAVAAATPKMEAAARVVVLAEADEWDAEHARRQALLDEHDAKQQKLLDALQKFTGLDWEVSREDRSIAETGPRVIKNPTREPLLADVRRAERTAWCLRELAEGRDPHNDLSVPFEGRSFQGIITGPDAREFYTGSVWGPDAVLPAPAYLQAKAAGTADLAPVEPDVAPGPPPGWGGVGEVTTWTGQPVEPVKS